MSECRMGYGRIVFFVLLLMSPIGFFIDEYAPSMPAMAQHFTMPIGSIQISITVFMLAMGITQISAGPIIDHFGRKKPLVIGLFVAVIGTVLSMVAHNYSILILGRVLQGIGLSISNLSPMAIQADCLKPAQIVKVSALFSMGYSLILVVAPVIGGYIQDYAGWRYNFAFLLVLAVFVLIATIFFFEETLPLERRRPIVLKQLLPQFATVIFNRSYFGAVSSAALINASLIVFSLIAPFIVQNTMRMSASTYGHMALIVAAGFLAGNILTSYLLNHEITLPEKIIKYGLTLAFACSCLQLYFSFGSLSQLKLLLPMIGLTFATGLVLPCFFGRAASVFKSLAGIASALIGTIILVIISIITAVLSSIHAHTYTQMAVAFLICSLATIFANYVIYKTPAGQM